jgi:tight adherence protein C
MDALLELVDGFGDDPAVTVGVLAVFGCGVLLLFAAGLLRERNEVRRRAAAETGQGPGAGQGRAVPARSLERLVTFIDANLSGEARQNRVLQQQLIQAGFFDRRAIAAYFGARLVGAVGLTVAGLLGLPFLLGDKPAATLWLWSAVLGIVGYFLPTLYVKRRIGQRALQHRMGFPDFMDLMIVCAEAGLSMEAAIERIARELVEGYPSLAENLYMVSLEIRAGKAFTEALDRLGERLGIEEAAMLATLLQQSAELGTSLSHSLRVYSEEMRNKRLSRAEEKAYSLPAKLTVPLILFIFPVLLFVLMLPVVIRVSQSSLGG